MAKDYYLGLDIGTASVGWAVTDENYKLLRAKGKDLWGVHLFEAANTAESRRLFRSARRRQQRKIARLNLLREMFEQEILPIDPDFFKRMEESKFYLEDKSIDEKFVLFADQKYTDKEFHKEFPTLYHLRKELIVNKNKKYDIRLYYLAIHHIMKRRGHFLFQGQSLSNVKRLQPVLDELLQYLKDEYDKEYKCSSVEEVEKVLTDKGLSITAKKNDLISLFPEADDQLKTLLALIAGGSVRFNKLFDDQSIEGEDNRSLKLSTDDLETKQSEFELILGERIQMLYLAKAVYDYAILSEILQGENYLSSAKVKDYEKHKSDLKLLKKVFENHLSKNDYKDFFDSCTTNEGNYAKYVGSTIVNGKKVRCGKKTTQEELYKTIKKKLVPFEETDNNAKEVLNQIELESFLPKQRNKDNGVIPYQVHLEELKMILQNAADHYPFLNEVSEGYSTKEKLIKLFEFRIPYYVGPLNDAHRINDGKEGFAWIVKKEDLAIRPWNFDEVVDKDKTAELFIRRMTNTCTYINSEEVLPKQSLLYAKYMVLNEINNIRINDEPISVELKQRIYTDLFQRYKKVTGKRLRDYLRREAVIGNDENEWRLSGFDGDFKSSLTAYHDFKSLKILDTCTLEELENIIFWATVYNGETEIIERKIQREIPRISSGDIPRISRLRYRDWGRLSRKFLNEIEGVDTQGDTGEFCTIMKMLWDTNYNLMELLSQQFTFSKVLEELNQTKPIDGINYRMLDELYVSPSVKRMIWRTLRIVDEIRDVLGSDPKKIFIEMAREEEKVKTRKVSRKQQLIDLYKKSKEEERDWISELEKEEERTYRQDRLYLYYTQKGKCMYSGEQIKLSLLFDKNIYDIDHIYPQSKTKDDSLNNRVLVLKRLNYEKGDRYPLPSSWRGKMYSFWNQLKEEGFISQIKFNRLTRTNQLTDEELSQFIARQLVETRQSTKVVASMLKSVSPESKIVYVKSKLTSEFRHDFDMLKVREINDLHHAHDAYLNIVTGNVYNTRFTDNPYRFIKNTPSYTLNKLFETRVKSGERIVWDKDSMIPLIKKTLSKPSVLYTRMPQEGKGKLFNASHVRASEINPKSLYLSLKNKAPFDEITKYGAYESLSTAYFFAVRHLRGKKREVSIETLPIYYKMLMDQGSGSLEEYAKTFLGLIDPEILVGKILPGTLVNWNGFKLHLTGKTGNRLTTRLGVQLYVDMERQKKLQKILSFNKKNSEYKNILKIRKEDGITEEICLETYDYLVDKHQNSIFSYRPNPQGEKLFEARDAFIKLSLEDKCRVISKILVFSFCVNGKADLREINLSPNTGMSLIPKDTAKNNIFRLIYQSPTGLYEKELDLLKQ